MIVVVHRWPILETKPEVRRTREALQTLTVPGRLQPKGKVQLMFGMGDWREFWSEKGTAVEKSMKDWVIDQQSLREIHQWRILEEQERARALRKYESNQNTSSGGLNRST